MTRSEQVVALGFPLLSEGGRVELILTEAEAEALSFAVAYVAGNCGACADRLGVWAHYGASLEGVQAKLDKAGPDDAPPRGSYERA